MSYTVGFEFDFSQIKLEKFLHHRDDVEQWYHALCNWLPKYEINTELRVAGFLSQTHHESGGYRYLSENLNYRWETLRRVFGRHFPTDEMAREYAHNPERIANRAYANRMGNGNEASGDGWRYRGQGLIQLTGRNNQSAFAEDTGILLKDVPDYLGTYSGAVHSACWFWHTNNLNHWADTGNVRQMTRRINGGYNGLDDRIKQYHRALKILGGTVPLQISRQTVRKGDTGPAVVTLQTALGITADGIFGPATEKVLREWQEQNGLVADGIAGPATYSRLYKED